MLEKFGSILKAYRASGAYLIAPDLMYGCLIGIQRKRLRTELDRCIRCQKHQADIEEEVIHERCSNLHRR